jgi:hypothetical protein
VNLMNQIEARSMKIEVVIRFNELNSFDVEGRRQRTSNIESRITFIEI